MPRPILAMRRLSTIPPGSKHPRATRSKAAASTLALQLAIVLSHLGHRLEHA
jgi:hypothetical protein